MPAGPLPPLLSGPITTANRNIYVDNLLPNALVTIHANGSNVGHATTANNTGSLLVPLSTDLHQGQEVTATQEYLGGNSSLDVAGTSEPSNKIVVQLPPNPLPIPTFASGITTCSDAVYLSNLIPGATVTISQNGNNVADGIRANGTTQAFTLNQVGLMAEVSLEAFQAVPGNQSPLATSLPVEKHPLSLPQPDVVVPLYPCQTAINLTHLIPSADFVVGNHGTETSAVAAWSNFELYDMPPLVAGTLTAQQSFRRCDVRPSPVAMFPVSTTQLPFPDIGYKPCQDVRQLEISNLVGGSTLSLFRVVTSGSNQVSKTHIGTQGVSTTRATVFLPSNFAPTDPQGTVSLWIVVTLCEAALPSPGHSTVEFAAPGAPIPAPTLRAPLYDCASLVVVDNLHPGSIIQIFSGSAAASVPRSNPTVVTGPELSVQLWTPLVGGESVFARQTGCNSSTTSEAVVVEDGKLDKPTIAAPVRPGAASVMVSNLLPGALVYLLVNGTARSQVIALGSVMALAVGAPALANGDKLEVLQSICKLTSAPGKATVETGTLHVSFTPSSLVEGEAAELLVTAIDAQTNAAVNGLPVTAARAFNPGAIGPSSTGVTGSSFAYTPGVHDTVAALLVSGAPGYIDAQINNISVLPPRPLEPTNLAPNNKTMTSPVYVNWTDPGFGTSRAATSFGITFSQGGHLVLPPMGGYITVNTMGLNNQAGPFSLPQGQVGWQVSGTNAGGTGPYASVTFNCISGPTIVVNRVGSGDEFQVIGSNFTHSGEVMFSVDPYLGTVPPIQKSFNASPEGGWEASVNCGPICSAAQGGILVFSAQDVGSGVWSNSPQEQCSS